MTSCLKDRRWDCRRGFEDFEAEGHRLLEAVGEQLAVLGIEGLDSFVG